MIWYEDEDEDDDIEDENDVEWTLFRMDIARALHRWGAIKSVTYILQWRNLAPLSFN